MAPDAQHAVHDLIQKMKLAATLPERERLSDDLETLVMMVAEPEVKYQAPMLATVHGKVCRCYPLSDD